MKKQLCELDIDNHSIMPDEAAYNFFYVSGPVCDKCKKVLSMETTGYIDDWSHLICLTHGTRFSFKLKK